MRRLECPTQANVEPGSTHLRRETVGAGAERRHRRAAGSIAVVKRSGSAGGEGSHMVRAALLQRDVLSVGRGT